ncbi:MAG: hypothetical protein ALECFALPRED_004361 [Alectoria fallacina]|uniref:Alpha/beta-hydrolase n=1 Tax=Alectoria fallacina TaxID=1903189 RepID=A0A8H3EME2_9LECA|nr:MAG: hypothetical protein ALECFALPRED_004361 [Alectoria fallacina]
METITYSQVDSLNIQLDLYLPPELEQGLVAAVVHFHGGGMIAGCRKILSTQHWLKDATLEHGILFISADHRLLYPSTGLDIIADIKNLFTFLASPSFSETHLPPGVTLDASRIAVSGESGGGYATRAAGIFAEPKPRALLLQYAQGGQLLDDHWLAVKGRDVPDPEGGIVSRESVAHLLNKQQEPISDDPMPFLGDDAPKNDSARTKLLLWWWRTGGLIDVVLGVNGMARFLRTLTQAQREGYIPSPLRSAILQTQLTETFPPTFLLHGKDDRLVLPAESQLTYDRLQELGVEAELHLLEGASHSLTDGMDPPNLAAGAGEVQRKAVEFLVHKLEAE